MSRSQQRRWLSAAFALAGAGGVTASVPYAGAVVGFDPGLAPDPYYNDPNAALGSPARDTGEGAWAGAVSIFNPPYNQNQLVTISEGGSLTLQLATPVNNDPAHLYGVDLSLFGNGGFIDGNYPHGRILSPAQTFGLDAMRIAVSADGLTFVTLPGVFTEGLFPTQGYLDGGPYDSTGTSPSDFSKPMNPALTLNSFAGQTIAQARALYDGSGGGTPIDISPSGLSSVNYLRIEVPDDGDPDTVATVEIDAVAAVPEPATGLILTITAGLLGHVRRERG